LKDWARNGFPFYTFPPEQPASATSNVAETLEKVYKKFDPLALEGLQTKTSLWAGSGLVKFDLAEVDPREVVLTAVGSSGREVEFDDGEGEGDEDTESDEGEVGDEEDEDSDEGSAILSDEEEEEEPVPSAKRKRKDQPEPVDRNVKAKKVAFAKEPPKSSKSSQVPRKAPQPAKKAPKVVNAKKGKISAPAEENEAYDFSKFF